MNHNGVVRNPTGPRIVAEEEFEPLLDSEANGTARRVRTALRRMRDRTIAKPYCRNGKACTV